MITAEMIVELATQAGLHNLLAMFAAEPEFINIAVSLLNDTIATVEAENAAAEAVVNSGMGTKAEAVAAVAEVVEQQTGGAVDVSTPSGDGPLTDKQAWTMLAELILRIDGITDEEKQAIREEFLKRARAA